MQIETLLDNFDREHLWHPYTNTINPTPAFKVVKAQGCTLTLANGATILDGTSSWWSAAHGYNNERINQALIKQLNNFAHVMFGGLTHDSAINLGKNLLSLLHSSLTKIFYSDSGSVAVEVAMKMALQYQYARGKQHKINFATIYRGYHGDTYNAMSVCDPISGMHTLFQGTIPVRYFIKAPSSNFNEKYNPDDLKELRALFEKHSNEIAALILEPIMQGAGGMYFYHPEFLNDARALCDEFDVLLIFDEIATGFYRTGELFAYHYTKVVPDIITLGKGLTAGYMSLACTICTDKIANTISQNPPHAFMHGPTFMANALACAVANESLNIFKQEPIKDKVKHIETILKEKLFVLKDRSYVKDVRVLGAVGVIELYENIDVGQIEPIFIEKGVWVRPFGNLIYTMPPFIMTTTELNFLTNAIIEVVDCYARKNCKLS